MNIEELKNRIDIVDVIGGVVKLTQRGESWIGLCPFHSEKSPSFNVRPSTNNYHCFGCGASGDVISFVQRYHSMSFIDSVELLADRYNIPIVKLSKEQQQANSDKKVVLEIMNDVVSTATDFLLHKDYAFAMEYLSKRGYDESDVKRFGLGFVPQNYLFPTLTKKHPIELLVKSTAFGSRQPSQEGGSGANGIYFRFSGRLIIPIKNVKGETIGLSGRIIDSTLNVAKYINSNESPYFKKGDNLFNLNNAKDFTKEQNSIIYITEGYFDCIRMTKSGVGGVVAPMGTAITPNQVSLLKRYTTNMCLLLDGDSAGQKAIQRSLPIFLEHNVYPSTVELPPEHDPDSYILENGADKFRELLETRKVDILAKLINDKTDELMGYSDSNSSVGSSEPVKNPTMSERVHLKDQLLKLTEKISDPIVKEEYDRLILDKLKFSSVGGVGAVATIIGGAGGSVGTIGAVQNLANKPKMNSTNVISLNTIASVQESILEGERDFVSLICCLQNDDAHSHIRGISDEIVLSSECKVAIGVIREYLQNDMQFSEIVYDNRLSLDIKNKVHSYKERLHNNLMTHSELYAKLSDYQYSLTKRKLENELKSMIQQISTATSDKEKNELASKIQAAQTELYRLNS